MSAGEMKASLVRKRDRVHPTNRRPDLPMSIKLTFGDLEAIIAALSTPLTAPSDETRKISSAA